MLRPVLCLLLVVGLAPLATGGEEEIPSSIETEIVVTATRMAQSLDSTGATLTVINAEDLKARQAKLVEDVLQAVPGAYMNLGGPPGSPASLFIRGAGSNQAVVLIDGIQANDPTVGGQFNFYDLTVDDVERIEVLRGSASSLYGSDAIGGVVNVISRPGEGDPGVTVGLEGGSYGYYRVGVSAYGEIDAFAFRLSGSRLRFRNDLRNNEFVDDAFAGNFEFDLGSGLVLDVRGRYIDSHAEDPWDYPFGEQIEEDPNIRRKRKTGLVGVGLSHDVSDVFSWDLDVSYFDVDSDFRNGPDESGDPLELSSRATGSVLNGTLLGNLHRIDVTDWFGAAAVGGFEYEDEKSKNRVESAFGPTPKLDKTVRNRAAFLVLETSWDDLVVSGGVRHDRNSFYGGVTKFSASLLYDLVATGTRFRANYGEGFRGPKPVEYSDPFIGNPDLGPEESVSLDFGLEQEFLEGDLNLSATWFQLRTSDLIAYDPETFRLENFDRTRTRGWEFSLSARPEEDLLVRGWLTLQDPKNLSDGGSRLPGRPKAFGGGEVRYLGKSWWAALEVVSSGDFPSRLTITPDGDRRNHPGRKLVLAVRGAYEVTPEVTLSARVENLTNDRWYDSVTAPDGLGRGFYLGVEIGL